MENKEVNTKPLYRVLEEQKTEGFLKVDYDHTNGKLPLTLVVGNIETSVGWEPVGSAWRESDAKYLCMSYNNLAPLAEALRNLLNMDTSQLNEKFPLSEWERDEVKAAIAALAAIS